MNAFLVITRYKRFSPDGDAVMEVFQLWKHLVLSDDPYTVVLGTELTLEQLAEQLRRFSFEYKVSELGKSVRIKGAHAKVDFSMGASESWPWPSRKQLHPTSLKPAPPIYCWG